MKTRSCLRWLYLASLTAAPLAMNCGASDTPDKPGTGGATATGGTGATSTGGLGGGNAAGAGGSPGSGAVTGTGGANAGGAGGGSTDATCDSVPVVCAGKGATDQVVADFEEGTATLKESTVLKGDFYTFNDGTAGGIQEPAPMSAIEPQAVCGGGRCSDAPATSKYALHMTAKGFTEWGGLIGTDLAYLGGTPPRTTYDASAYTGVAFWARAGKTAATAKDRKVRFVFIDGNTDPAGGKCKQGGTAVDACYNDWGVDLTLTPEWTRYEIPFATLKQTDWGMKFPAFEKGKIYGMQWKFAKAVNLDIWVDDIAFYK